MALSAQRPYGTLHFPSPSLNTTKQGFRFAAAAVGAPVTGKGLWLAPSISVEPDGIRGWSGGKNVKEEFFYPRENASEIFPFFIKEGARTFPAICVTMFAQWVIDEPEPSPRTEDFTVVIPVSSVSGDKFAQYGGYERAEAIAQEAARILRVNYLSPEALEARVTAQHLG